MAIRTDYTLKRFTASFAVCAVLVWISYRFIDKPVVFFLHAHGARQYSFLHWIQKIPNALLPMLAVALVYLGYKRYKKSFTYFDRFILSCAISLILISVLKFPIKYFFARHWPSSFCNNLSLLEHGVYGFSFFNIGKAYEAFPSGNAAKIFAMALIGCHYYPRWCWLGILAVIVSIVGVVGLYYHFVGDVVAGAFFGIVMAIISIKQEKRIHQKTTRQVVLPNES